MITSIHSKVGILFNKIITQNPRLVKHRFILLLRLLLSNIINNVRCTLAWGCIFFLDIKNAAPYGVAFFNLGNASPEGLAFCDICRLWRPRFMYLFSYADTGFSVEEMNCLLIKTEDNLAMSCGILLHLCGNRDAGGALLNSTLCLKVHIRI